MSHEQRRDDCIAADHPCLEGHFPGNPIVPGVVLIDCVLAAIRSDSAPPLRQPLRAIPNLKFLQPLRPQTPFAICWNVQGDSVRFRCESGAGDAVQVHVQGVLRFQSDAG
jgi:3-hydroxyacyl-[acyl-carrier-protein] dehydratase